MKSSFFWTAVDFLSVGSRRYVGESRYPKVPKFPIVPNGSRQSRNNRNQGWVDTIGLPKSYRSQPISFKEP